MVSDNLDSSRPGRRLGFREIVPGQDGLAPEDKTDQDDVPQYDLGQQLMANQRRVVASTRRRPGQKEGPSPEVSASPSPARHFCRPPVSGGDSDNNKRTASDTDALRPGEVQRVRKAVGSDGVSCPPMTDQHRQVIAEIVSRDIHRLCRGEKVFGF